MLQLLLIVGSTTAFSIIEHTPNKVLSVELGESFALSCTVDGFYEWCTFARGDRKCDYEWKRTVWNVTELDCAHFADRAEFQGDYDKNECGITIRDASPADSGEWTCSLEEYRRGGNRGEGAQTVQTFSVVVNIPTTTTTTTTTAESASMMNEETATPPSLGGQDAAENEYMYEDSEELVLDLEVQPQHDMDQKHKSNTADSEEDVSDDDISPPHPHHHLPLALAILTLLVILTTGAIFGLHHKQRLPACCFSACSGKWKPVLVKDDLKSMEEEEEVKHPSIIKNGIMETNLSVSELGPMSEAANLNPDMTSISWVQDEKICEDQYPEDERLEDKNLEEKTSGDIEPALSTREV